MKHILVVAVGALALVACGKATETAAEKVIESQIAKDGGSAKVNLGDGGIKMTTTDASGKTTQLEIGTAKVSEADIGLPFYPGTQPRDGETTKVKSTDGTMFTVILHSEDAPDKVAGFYRDKLKAQAQGNQFTETSGDGSYMLLLADEKNKQSTHVMVAKGETKGSDIQIMANRGEAK
jgi:opacity protein-like surface antigen